jgi:hypothetical protein
MAARPSRRVVMENDKQPPQAQSRGQRTLTVSTLYRQWGSHHKNDCYVPNIRLNGKWLGQTCGKTGWQVHAYCLMNNHFQWEVRVIFQHCSGLSIVSSDPVHRRVAIHCRVIGVCSRSWQAILTLFELALARRFRSLSVQPILFKASRTRRSAKAWSVSRRSDARSPFRPRRASFSASQSAKSSAPIFQPRHNEGGLITSSARHNCCIRRENSRRV